jgi:hypothetical protein
MEHILQLNLETESLELSDSIRDSMSEFFSDLPFQYSTYFTLTFKDTFDFKCQECINEFYLHGKPVRHWHNVSYSYVNKMAQEISEYFPKRDRLVVVEGATDYKSNIDASNEAREYLKIKGTSRGDSNYKNITSGRRPHIHGVVHGYDELQFKHILSHSSYFAQSLNLNRPKVMNSDYEFVYCDCHCCTNWKKHEHSRNLIQKEYYDEDHKRIIKEYFPTANSTLTDVGCHIFSPQPKGQFDVQIIPHGADTTHIIQYLYKYMFKDLKNYQSQKNLKQITSYLTQESYDSHVKVY